MQLPCKFIRLHVTAAQIRYSVRRIRRKTNVRMIIALLGDSSEVNDQELLGDVQFVHHTIKAVVDEILAIAHESPAPLQSAAPSLQAVNA